MILLGEKIYHASFLSGRTRKFGERWWKIYNKSSIQGLYTNYIRVRRPSFLSNENKVELEKKHS